jgi:hypothetical protein
LESNFILAKQETQRKIVEIEKLKTEKEKLSTLLTATFQKLSTNNSNNKISYNQNGLCCIIFFITMQFFNQ